MPGNFLSLASGGGAVTGSGRTAVESEEMNHHPTARARPCPPAEGCQLMLSCPAPHFSCGFHGCLPPESELSKASSVSSKPLLHGFAEQKATFLPLRNSRELRGHHSPPKRPEQHCRVEASLTCHAPVDQKEGAGHRTHAGCYLKRKRKQ